jgi:hypothetical protein
LTARESSRAASSTFACSSEQILQLIEATLMWVIEKVNGDVMHLSM